MKRGSVLVAAALAVALPCVALAGDGKVTIGARPLAVDGAHGTQACTAGPHCLWVQQRLEGGVARAPFSGTVRSWKILGPNGSFQLAVVRKHGPNQWKLVRASDGVTLSAGPFEVEKLFTHLRIRKGDWLGITASAFGASSFTVDNGQPAGSCRIGFVPGPSPGETDSPDPGSGGCGDLILMNARITR